MSQQHFGPTSINSATGLHLLLLSVLLAFFHLSIAQIFQSGQNQHCSAEVSFYTYDTFYVDPCPIVRACVY